MLRNTREAAFTGDSDLAADFLLTEENVHTAVVYGVLRKDRHAEALVGSMRTTKLTLSPDRFLKEALGVDETGRSRD
jgi:nanoRNase/pAp phosphatase (c-di-AMP/oligoRNAs hydrolase)